MAVPVSSAFLKTTKADGVVVVVSNVMANARDRAIGERRNFEIHFVSNDHIQIYRDEVPSGAQTLISDTVLENGQQFKVFAALPDTPDAFGKSAAVKFTGTGPWMFTSDGSFIDSNGDIANGTVFVGVPNEPGSAGAVTVFGATGLLRTWRWRNTTWFNH
jgi:hypothetical protein